MNRPTLHKPESIEPYEQTWLNREQQLFDFLNHDLKKLKTFETWKIPGTVGKEHTIRELVGKGHLTSDMSVRKAILQSMDHIGALMKTMAEHLETKLEDIALRRQEYLRMREQWEEYGRAWKEYALQVENQQETTTQQELREVKERLHTLETRPKEKPPEPKKEVKPVDPPKPQGGIYG